MFEVSVEKSSQSPEMDRFRSALKSVMRVSKEDLNKILAQEKAANADKPKRGPKRTV
jgi:hypothetical protein